MIVRPPACRCHRCPSQSLVAVSALQSLQTAIASQQAPILSLAGPMETQAAALNAFNATVWPRA
jgi:hypothetical protein